MLVQQQKLGGHHGGHQQRQGLPLAAGEQPHRLAHPVLQAHVQLLQLVPEHLPVLLGKALEGVSVGGAEIGQGQVFLNGHVGGRALQRVLEQPPDAAAPLVLRQKGDVRAAQGNAAGIHIKAAADGVEQGGLSRAVGADDRDELPLFQMEGQVRDGLFLVDGAGVEGLGNMLNVQHVSFLPFRRPASASGKPPTAGCWGRRWPGPR